MHVEAVRANDRTLTELTCSAAEMKPSNYKRTTSDCVLVRCKSFLGAFMARLKYKNCNYQLKLPRRIYASVFGRRNRMRGGVVYEALQKTVWQLFQSMELKVYFLNKINQK